METNMDTDEEKAPSKRGRSWIATAAIATGLAVGAAGLAGAATGSSSTSATNSTGTAAATAPAPGANRPDPSTLTNGPGETLLTGDTATQVKAAALAAVPGATIVRVETDSSGAAYEAHLKKADGSFVTVRFDSNIKVTSTDDGFGPGPQGQAPPAGAAGTSTTSSN